jgi:hypothetical protein
MREIEIQIGSMVAVAKLLDKEAPKHCDSLWNSLPIESTVHHSKMAGGQLYLITPSALPEELANAVAGNKQQPGDIVYAPSVQELEIMYSEPGFEPIDFTLLGRITENLDGLRAVGREIWLNPGQRVIIRKKGQKETPRGYKARTSRPKILRELEKRIEEIWFGSPTEIENLKNPKGGVFQYAFSHISYAYAEFYQFAPTLWTLKLATRGATRIGSKRVTVPIESVKSVTRALLLSHALMLDIYGLNISAELFRKSSDALENVTNASEYCEIADRLVLYCNKMAEGGCLDALMSWGRYNCLYDGLLRHQR